MISDCSFKKCFCIFLQVHNHFVSGYSLFLRVQVRQMFDFVGGNERQPSARRLPGRTRSQPLLTHQKQITHSVLQVSHMSY